MDVGYAAAYPELYRKHWWWRVRERILLDKIASLVSGKRRARLLDVGCGAGLFFEALERFGYVEGIESDDAAVRRSGIWQKRIVAAQLDEQFVPSEPYDLVLLLDVLEHVSEPEALLRAAGRVLRPDGHIVITVPAFSWLWTSHDALNHHLRRYTAGQMRAALSHGGLVTDEARYFFQSLIVPKILLRAVEAVATPPPAVPSIPGRRMNWLLQLWFRFEYRAAGWLPFGGSLLAVAHLPERAVSNPNVR